MLCVFLSLLIGTVVFFFFFFFNDTATTEIYTLSLHDALPISMERAEAIVLPGVGHFAALIRAIDERGLREPLLAAIKRGAPRSEEHTSELQSQSNLVCRLLLEKKKKKNKTETRLIHAN